MLHLHKKEYIRMSNVQNNYAMFSYFQTDKD